MTDIPNPQVTDLQATASEHESQLKHIIDYEYEGEPSWFNRLLYFSAGVDKQLLKYCTNYDRVKAQGIGGIVLATATLAFFSGSYAFYIVFNPKNGGPLSAAESVVDIPYVILAIVFGIIWASVIYNLDRFIVSTGGHGDGTDKITGGEAIKALPRLLMACVIGLVLSKPLEIKIMESELNAAIQAEVNQKSSEFRAEELKRFEQSKAELSKKIQDLQSERAKEEKKVEGFRDARDKAIQEYQAELSGTRPGDGPIAKQKLRIKEEKEGEYAVERAKIEPRVKELEEELKTSMQDLDTKAKGLEQALRDADKRAHQFDGLIIRIVKAHELYFWSTTAIMLLLIMIEVSPIFFKMMLSLSPIDYLTENQKRIAIAARGIELRHKVDNFSGGEGITDLKTAVYHRANLVSEISSGALKTQYELTQLANQAYRAQTAEKIEKDVDQFVVKTNDKS